jgi:hypothetical protein
MIYCVKNGKPADDMWIDAPSDAEVVVKLNQWARTHKIPAFKLVLSQKPANDNVVASAPGLSVVRVAV